jgi:ketosteroid isomerase-like protein
MSRENVELVRSIVAAWERGDFNSVEWAHPEIEYVFAGGPSPGSWTGVGGMREGARANLTAWEDFKVEAEEFRRLDGERVLVFHSFTGRGRRSGLQLEKLRAKGASLFYVRAGKVTRLIAYMDSELALADLGLSEQELSG